MAELQKSPIIKAIACLVLAIFSLGASLFMHYSAPAAKGILLLYVVLAPMIAFLIVSGFATTPLGLFGVVSMVIIFAIQGHPVVGLLVGGALVAYATLGNWVFWTLWGPRKPNDADKDAGRTGGQAQIESSGN